MDAGSHLSWVHPRSEYVECVPSPVAAFPPAMNGRVPDFGHSERRVTVSHCCFNLQFCDDVRTSPRVFICHLYIFGEVSVTSWTHRFFAFRRRCPCLLIGAHEGLGNRLLVTWRWAVWGERS